MKRLLLFLLLLPALATSAADQRITATITFTNTPAYPNTVTVNGNARTWTNAITSSPSTLLLIGADRLISATNYANGVFATPYGGPIAASFTQGSNIVLVGQVNQALVVTFSGTYARVAYSTQAVALTYTVRIPVSSEPLPSQRTNVASELVAAINNYPSNFFISGNAAMAEIVGRTNVQTISGQKRFTATNIFDTLWATNPVFVAPTLTLATGSLTNPVIWSARITNSFLDRVNMGIVTNGYLTNAIIDRPKLTNGVNYGGAFSSVGSGSGSEQFGAGAVASGAQSTALGNSATASGPNGIAIGYLANSSSNNSVAIGPAAEASNGYGVAIGAAGVSGYNGTAIGNSATVIADYGTAIGPSAVVDAGHHFSTAIGYGSTTTASNQLMLGSSQVDAVVNHQLQVLGWITNSMFVGANTWPGQLAYTSTARTGLANGNNAGIVLGTNVFVRLSGASTIASIAGFAAEPDGSHKFITLRGAVTNNVLNESGVDAVAANRIQTGTGGTLVLTNAPATLELLYDATAARWIVIKASN